MDAILELTGLADRAGDRTDAYSGGMKRRLNIGIGLLHEPQLLVLDEPTVGVDPQSRNAILEAVDDLRAGGMSILYTTHYMEEAERLCDRIAIIDAGRILAEGTRPELVALVGQLDHVTLAASGSLPAAAQAIAALERVEGATVAEGSIEVTAREAAHAPAGDHHHGHGRGHHDPQRGGHRAGPRGGLPPPHRTGPSD